MVYFVSFFVGLVWDLGVPFLFGFFVRLLFSLATHHFW